MTLLTDRFAVAPFSGRLGIHLAVGLVQGVLIALLQIAAYQTEAASYREVIAALAVAVVFGGVGWQLLSGRDDRAVPYGGLAALVLGCAVMSALVVATLGDGSLASWICSLFVLGFVGMVALQCDGAPGRRLLRADYAEVAAYAWHHALLLALAGAVTGVFFMLVQLTSALFNEIGIHAVSAIFNGDLFIYPAIGVVASSAVWLGRRNGGVLAAMRVFAFAVCRGLLPLAALVVLGFTAVVLIEGVGVLWQTGRPTPILLSLIIFLGVMLNGVYTDGLVVAPYPTWLRRVVEASLLAAVFLAGIACYSVGLRIQQYGLMPDRFVGMVIAVLALIYTASAAWAVVRPGATWLPTLGRSNIINALIVCAVLVIIHLPGINPEQISVRDQLNRVLSGTAHRDTDSLYALKNQMGDAGERAYARAQAAVNDTSLPTERRDAIRAALEKVERTDFYPMGDDAVEPVKNYRMEWVGPALADVETFEKADLDETGCGVDVCVARAIDLNGDGEDELLVTTQSNGYYSADFYARTANGPFRRVGRMMVDHLTTQDKSLVELLKSDSIRTFEPKYRSIDLGGVTLHPEARNEK